MSYSSFRPPLPVMRSGTARFSLKTVLSLTFCESNEHGEKEDGTSVRFLFNCCLGL